MDKMILNNIRSKKGELLLVFYNTPRTFALPNRMEAGNEK
ncbi:hypothetical protein SAMN06269173_1032 [Hymenobacter mucosus]|uniref:Uncharacterized protein n=1 Tax=Hymenobacter mucosus TaxID=1411120 RepID=A0A238WRH2_9BACT|nr:hypothetical protein SAMN06269173_1032 [Hymenobacter mucosus]